MRLHLLVATALVVAAPAAFAEKAKPVPAPAAAPAAAPKSGDIAPSATMSPGKDPIVAKVDTHDIHLSDLDAVMQELPQNMRTMPAEQLYPVLVDQLVDRQALAIKAKQAGLQNDPAVVKAMARAQDQVLQNALLRKDLGPQINEASLRALYDKEIGSKPGEPEIQASHILVPTEDAAKKLIKQLQGGADFATLAKANSTDPSGKQNGGDLGYFKKGDMLPAFSTAAFDLKDGEFTKTPVKTQYGYHVIKVFHHRLSSPPSFADSQQQLQQKLVQELVQREVTTAKQGLKIERFNSDGSVPKGAPIVVMQPHVPGQVAPSGAPK